MDRSTLSRVLLAVGVFFLVYSLFTGKGCGKNDARNSVVIQESFEPLPLPDGTPPSPPCTIDTPSFDATIATIGGGIQSYRLKGSKYVEQGQPIDTAHRTSIDANGKAIFEYTPLRATFRTSPAETQVPGDQVAYLAEKQGSACVLNHRTPGVVEIVRKIRPTERPYELDVETTIKNLAGAPRTHAFTTTLYALQFKAQEGGFLHRPSPNDIYQAACSHDGGKLERRDKSKLHDWFVQGGNIDFVTISSSYVGQAIAPLEPSGGHCALLAQERGVGTSAEQALFHAAISYPPRELAPQATLTYHQLAFSGPKERPILAAAGGGGHRLTELIDLGYFSAIAKILVAFLAFVHGVLGSWGLAIIVLTVTVRVVLLPLTLPMIRSQVAMRKLKPELDIVNKKFEGDQQAKMLATQQLYKKHGVNPLAGCAPSLLQMPVWFALYSALQTAIELYHEPFSFWRDLSSPDPHFILPLVLGATMFIQQKVTPMQMDPAQQKIFTYFMPAMFTVFMLFLPAGLGVYMLTNSVLGIGQTLAVERYMKKHAPPQVKVEVVSTSKGGKEARPARELARAPKIPGVDKS